MYLLTSILLLLTAQAPQDAASCIRESTCFYENDGTSLNASLKGRLRGSAASGFTVELDEPVRFLKEPFAASKQPRVIPIDAAAAEKLVGQWVGAQGTLRREKNGLRLEEAHVSPLQVFDFLTLVPGDQVRDRFCTEAARKRLDAWAAAREIPDAGRFAEVACLFIGTAKGANLAQHLTFPFTYGGALPGGSVDCDEAFPRHTFKTAKQLEAKCGSACYTSRPGSDYTIAFSRDSKGRWNGSVSAMGTYSEEDELSFVREKPGAWKLNRASRNDAECQ